MTVTQAVKNLLILDWEILPTSCMCGGGYAWAKPRPSGALEMVGCVCHHNPVKLYDDYMVEQNWRIIR